MRLSVLRKNLGNLDPKAVDEFRQTITDALTLAAQAKRLIVQYDAHPRHSVSGDVVSDLEDALR